MNCHYNIYYYVKSNMDNLPDLPVSDSEVYGSYQGVEEGSADSDSSTMVGEVLSDIDSEEASAIAAAAMSSGNESKEVASSDDEEEDENSKECQTEHVTCGVCYKNLYVGNSVTTVCNHSFCNTCFFRWIEVNTQCPLCRAPVDSKTNLTDEQLRKEQTEVYETYNHYLYENVMLFREQQNLTDKILRKREECVKLKSSTDALLMRQIRLRQTIENTRGYNEGQLAAVHNLKTNAHKEAYSSIILETMKRDKHFMHGFMKGLEKEDQKLKLFQKIILYELNEKMMDIGL